MAAMLVTLTKLRTDHQRLRTRNMKGVAMAFASIYLVLVHLETAELAIWPSRLKRSKKAIVQTSTSEDERVFMKA